MSNKVCHIITDKDEFLGMFPEMSHFFGHFLFIERLEFSFRNAIFIYAPDAEVKVWED